MPVNVNCMPKNLVMLQMGELLRSLTVQTAFCGQLKGFSNEVHEKTVDATILAIPTRGRYEVWHSDEHWIIKPGETFVVPSRTPVKIRHHTNRQGQMHAKWIHMHMTLHGTIDLLSLFELPGRLTQFRSQPISDAIDQLLEMTSPVNESQKLSQLLLTEQLTSMIARHLIGYGRLAPQRLYQMQQSVQLVPVFEAIAQHLHKPIHIENLCHWAHLSASRLHVVFKQVTGMPPMRYVMQARLTQARQQLVYTDRPVS